MNHGVKTGLSVPTVSTPGWNRSFCRPAFEQAAAVALGEAAALLPLVPPPPPLLPHAASTAAVAAMATAGRIRRIGKPPVRAGIVAPGGLWQVSLPACDAGRTGATGQMITRPPVMSSVTPVIQDAAS